VPLIFVDSPDHLSRHNVYSNGGVGTLDLSAVISYPHEVSRDQYDILWTVDGHSDFEFATPPNSLMTMVRLSDLQLSNKQYTFKLSAFSIADSASSSASVTISLNAPPKSGSFTVSPSSGLALIDDFHFSCSNWVDDASDLPLNFAYKYSNMLAPSQGNNYLQEASSSQHYNTSLPIGPLNAIASISDVYGASAEVNTHVHSYAIEMGSNTADELSEIIESAFIGKAEDKIKIGDGGSVFQAIMSVISYVDMIHGDLPPYNAEEAAPSAAPSATYPDGSSYDYSVMHSMNSYPPTSTRRLSEEHLHAVIMDYFLTSASMVPMTVESASTISKVLAWFTEQEQMPLRGVDYLLQFVQSMTSTVATDDTIVNALASFSILHDEGLMNDFLLSFPALSFSSIYTGSINHLSDLISAGAHVNADGRLFTVESVASIYSSSEVLESIDDAEVPLLPTVSIDIKNHHRFKPHFLDGAHCKAGVYNFTSGTAATEDIDLLCAEWQQNSYDNNCFKSTQYDFNVFKDFSSMCGIPSSMLAITGSTSTNYNGVDFVGEASDNFDPARAVIDTTLVGYSIFP